MSTPPDTPRLAAPPFDETPGATSMRERVSQRLFGLGGSQRFGRYIIERRLGAGGMGVVYAAFDEELSRKVAIKLVRADRARSIEQDKLRHEARALAQLSHPNVVQIHEVGTEGDQLYLVMEYIQGRTLDVWARGRTQRERLRYCVQAGRGLAAAHQAGLLHRDVKPNNIVVGDDGRVRVVDFGLARPQIFVPPTPADTDTNTNTNTSVQTSPLAGTPVYLAPELYAGTSASPASDQFGFCVTVWQVLADTRPFTSEQLLAAADGASLRPITSLRPRWLGRALLRGLDPNPAKRWPSLDVLLDEIDARPRQRLLTATFFTVALTCASIATVSLGPLAPACQALAPAFAQVWNPERRARIAASWALRPRADAELDALARAIEGHEVKWRAAHEATCPATTIGQMRSSGQPELAGACLKRNLDQFDALLNLLESSPTEELDARRLLQELGDPSQCADASVLADQLPPPAELASRVAQLRAHIDRVAVLMHVRPREAGVEAGVVVARARELGYRPALAEALTLDGKIAIRLLDDVRALDSLREAAREAKAVGDARLEFVCLRELVRLTTQQLEDPERAADLVALMLGSFEQLGRPPRLLAPSLIAQSELARARGDNAEAELHLREAAEYLRESVDDGDVNLEQVELLLANLLGEQGKLEESRRLYEQLLGRLRAALGPRHPSVATVEFNLGLTLFEIGSGGLAIAHIERALSIQREAFGSDAPKIAPALVILAQVRALEGDLEGALLAAREAWPLERALASGNSERGSSLRLLAALLGSLDRYQEALETWELIERELGSTQSPLERAMTTHTIGWYAYRVGEVERARERFEQAVTYEDPQVRLAARLGLAEIALGAGAASEAREQVEELLVKLEGLPPSESKQATIAEAHYIRLRCLVESRQPDEVIAESREQVRVVYKEIFMPKYIRDELARLDAKR
ncbi:serine/threonine-protein kinase [Enhygromyxa salina]|uniref:Serine/threonine-protein kinase PknA n=1 Tax=Enhygromyxa salina TaxID=215803 RepID=A0A2S9Y4F5_9BACT|nr:serine/threonine-protein kinase [Enhygromyxa salina]PRP99976.1 Serine/threonine-protein kinase PknA [Enhygromyxa salina]